MGRLDNPLPVAYQYRPLDPKPKRRLRRRAVLKFTLFLVLVGMMGTLGYLVLVSEGYYNLLRYIPFSDKFLNSIPHERLVVVDESFSPGSPLFEPLIKEAPIPSSSPPPPPPLLPTSPPPLTAPQEPKVISLDPKNKIPETVPSVRIKEPAPFEPRPKHETITTTPTDSPFSSIWSGFLTPEMAGPLIRTLLNQAADTFLGTLADVMTRILPMETVNQLGDTFTAVANYEIPLSQALENVFIPVSQTASRLLFDYFPELGGEAVDSATNFFTQGAALVRSSDTKNMVVSASSGMTSFLAPIIGVSEVNYRQVSRIFEEFLNSVLPDMDRINLKDTSTLLPNFQTIQSSAVKVATQIASLKAQEKLVSTAFDYLSSGGSKKSTGSDGSAGGEQSDSGAGFLGNMASQLLSSYLGGGTGAAANGPEIEQSAQRNSEQETGAFDGAKRQKKNKKNNKKEPTLADSMSSLMNMIGFGGESDKENKNPSGTSSTLGSSKPAPMVKDEPPQESANKYREKGKGRYRDTSSYDGAEDVPVQEVQYTNRRKGQPNLRQPVAAEPIAVDDDESD